jgi:AraC family transcriptional regulator
VKPRIVKRPAMHLVGVRGLFTPATIPEIPALWGRFVPRMDEIPGQTCDVTYGVCQDAANGEGTFAYTAAVEVEAPGDAPAGMVGFTIPAGTWAVFTHEGHISKISETFDAIARTGLSTAGLERASNVDIEVYDDRWDPATGTGDVDIYVSVKPPG